jgi:hypothetical protein
LPVSGFEIEEKREERKERCVEKLKNEPIQ